MIQDEQSSSNFHIVHFQLSNQLFGRRPFSGGVWCVASADNSGRWTLREAQQEAQREWDLSQPKAVPDTDHASKHVSPFCWDLYWNILVVTAHNLLTQSDLFEIALMVLSMASWLQGVHPPTASKPPLRWQLQSTSITLFFKSCFTMYPFYFDLHAKQDHVSWPNHVTNLILLSLGFSR